MSDCYYHFVSIYSKQKTYWRLIMVMQVKYLNSRMSELFLGVCLFLNELDLTHL